MASPINLSASEISLAASDPFGLWHDHHGDPKLKDKEDDYALFLRDQGLRIEKELLLKRHPRFIDMKAELFDSAVEQTAELLKSGQVVIYGGALKSEALGLRARPDVIHIEEGACFIDEYKLAAQPDESHKIQALVYAFLLKNGYGIQNEPRIISRLNQTYVVPYDEARVEEAIKQAREVVARKNPPYPVYNCRSRWKRLQNLTAHNLLDVTLAWNVGAAHADEFHRMGVHTLKELVKMDPESLSMIKGLGKKRVKRILNSAKAQLTKKVISVGPFKPAHNSPELEIFLDLEGSGELFQDDPAWNCLYLIGLIPRSRGREEPYISYMAGVPGDEKEALTSFLNYLSGLSVDYRLYHWDHYERTQLKKVCERHGMMDAYDSLIQARLEDLCGAAQASYILPVPGYSIKVVAPYFGFRWAQAASEVDAMKSAMIWFRQALKGGTGLDLEKVLKYNEDDCRAMLVVKDGLKELDRKNRSLTDS